MKNIIMFVIVCLSGTILSCRGVTIESEIVSLKNNSEIKGSFILGTGSIGQEEYYYYYVKMKDGGLVRAKSPTEMTVIYEGYSSPKVTWTHIPGGDDNEIPPEHRAIRLYVPSNTIIKTFEVE